MSRASSALSSTPAAYEEPRWWPKLAARRLRRRSSRKKCFRQTWNNADKGDTLRNELRDAIASGAVFRGRDAAYDEFVRKVTAPAAALDLPKPRFAMTTHFSELKGRGRRENMRRWLFSEDGGDGPVARAGGLSLREVSEEVDGKGMCYVCGRKNVRTVAHECSILGGFEDDGRYKAPVWVCAMGVANDIITLTSGGRRTCFEVFRDPCVTLNNIETFKHQSKPQNNPAWSTSSSSSSALGVAPAPDASQSLEVLVQSPVLPEDSTSVGLATATPRSTPRSTPTAVVMARPASSRQTRSMSLASSDGTGRRPRKRRRGSAEFLDC